MTRDRVSYEASWAGRRLWVGPLPHPVYGRPPHWGGGGFLRGRAPRVAAAAADSTGQQDHCQ